MFTVYLHLSPCVSGFKQKNKAAQQKNTLKVESKALPLVTGNLNACLN
jgi:hypothetical protein